MKTKKELVIIVILLALCIAGILLMSLMPVSEKVLEYCGNEWCYPVIDGLMSQPGWCYC